MRVVVAGSRDLLSPSLVDVAVEALGVRITLVMSGACPTGADAFGEAWALRHRVPVARYPPDWNRFGASAGPRRNAAMAEACDAAVVVLWETGSRGSENMIECMARHPAKPCRVVRVPRVQGVRELTTPKAPHPR